MRYKTVAELNLMDRALFAEAVEDCGFAEDMQAIIFGENTGMLMRPVSEKEIRNHSLKKYIRVDVWMENESGEILSTEVQKENTGNIPKRSRYYQSIIDSKQLEPGETDYNKLENVKIIIIASFDLFGQGKYCYSFTMRCDEDHALGLMDGGQRIFLNTKGTDPENISEELKWMLRYFESSTRKVAEQSGSERILRMHNHVEKIKSNEEFSFRYLRELEDRALARAEAQAEGRAEGIAEGRAEGKAEGREEGIAEGRAAGIAEGRAEGKAEGREEGIAENKQEMARRMRKESFALDVIERITGLSANEISKL